MPEPGGPVLTRGPNYAMFVDYDNISIAIDQRAKAAGSNVVAGEAVVKTLDRLRETLGAKEMGSMTFRLGRAYGDWTGVTDAPSSLALMSIKPVDVLAKPGKSSADLELSLDAQETLLTRDDIEHFVIAGGDRDYIPIVSRILERGKGVTVAALGETVSGDLKAIVGAGFIDLGPLVAPLVQPPAEVAPAETEKAIARKKKPASAIPLRSEAARSAENLDRALDLIVQATVAKRVDEVSLVAFYKNFMNEAFVTLTDGQRKEIVEALRQKGAVSLEIRPGPFAEYVVMIVNRDHPMVTVAIARGKL